MAAFFSASVRAPITGTVLILEMTGSFQHLMVLAIASAIAYIVAELCGSQPIYEELMVRALKKKDNPALVSGTRDIVEIAVCSGSQLDNKQLRHIHWPPQTVVVDVKRGQEELIPENDLQLHSGDFVYVLTNTEHEQEGTRLRARDHQSRWFIRRLLTIAHKKAGIRQNVCFNYYAVVPGPPAAIYPTAKRPSAP
jgi:NhaP-type Na+/H+ and K+/H+ antiporter